MRYCPICERTYGDEVRVCEVDGAILKDSGINQDPLIGKVVRGRYRVLEKLGEGGMGTVYLAEQIAINRKVALKILHPDYARDQEFVRRFRQEAKLAAALNHRNIITVFDFDQADDGSLYIVMEYVAGKSLSGLIQDGPINLRRVMRLGVQIAEGLRAAHVAGVIHRDIKPENIMVVGEEEIKLMDFGIARLTNTEAATRLTRSGMIMGTPTYMAPEQIEGGEVGEATDIYAFGIVLYEMLSGRVPFTAPTPGAILIKHLQEVPAPLRKLRKEIPISLEKVVKQALEKKPAQRQKSMNEIVESLANTQQETAREQATASVIAQQLTAAGRRFSSISTLLRRLLERASLRARTRTGEMAELQLEHVEISIEASQIHLEQPNTVAETKPPTIIEHQELQSAASSDTDNRLRNLPPNGISSVEPTAIDLIQTQSWARRQQTADEFTAEAKTLMASVETEAIPEVITMTATQPVEEQKAASWRQPALTLAAAVLIGIVATVVYLQVSDQQIGSTPLRQETSDARSLAEGVASTKRDLPVRAQSESEKSLQAVSGSGDKTGIPLSEKNAGGQVSAAPIPSPVAEGKNISKKNQEIFKQAELKGRTDVVKVSPAPETPLTKKLVPEEIKVAEKPKEADLEKYKTPGPVKKESETKLASIDKPSIKQPEVSPASPETRLLSLAIVSSKRDINVQERVVLTVRGKYSDGKENEIGAGVRFESSDANVAVVNSRGELEGKKQGKAEVTARYAGVVSGVYTFYVKGGAENQKADQSGEPLQDQRRRLLR